MTLDDEAAMLIVDSERKGKAWEHGRCVRDNLRKVPNRWASR